MVTKEKLEELGKKKDEARKVYKEAYQAYWENWEAKREYENENN